MNNIIVGMGEALWDVLPEGKKIGGAPANFAYHVSQFGFDSRVVSAVGNDELGDEILRVFNEKKLKTQIERVDYPTGTVQVTLDDEGVPCYEIKEGVAWDNIPFTDELKRLALNTRAVCFGSLAQRNEVSRATINRFLDTMPDIDGQLKIFDINLRQDFYSKEVIRESCQRCNVLKINDEELVTISRMFGYPGIDLQELSLRKVSQWAAFIIFLLDLWAHLLVKVCLVIGDLVLLAWQFYHLYLGPLSLLQLLIYFLGNYLIKRYKKKQLLFGSCFLMILKKLCCKLCYFL